MTKGVILLWLDAIRKNIEVSTILKKAKHLRKQNIKVWAKY